MKQKPPTTSKRHRRLRAELNFTNDLPYEILNSAVHPWSHAEYENQFVNVTETLFKWGFTKLDI